MRASLSAKGDMNWAEFLGRPAVGDDPALARSVVEGQSVLITGAGGSIGSGLAKRVLAGRPRRLVLLDLSEGALYESFRRLSAIESRSEVVPVTGNVGDVRLLDHLFRQHRPELVFHAAAYKHVPLMERNPFSAIANNSLGTWRLVLAAREAGVSRLLAVSTDKAVNPLSVMGVSKRIAELAVLAHSTSETAMNVVRLCNVLGSSGSVAEIFQEQAELGIPLTVTHPEAKRYFVTSTEAERAILSASASPVWGRVLVPDCGEEFCIRDLARYVTGRCGEGYAEIEFIGLRSGDKLREELWAGDETVEALLPDGMRVLKSSALSVPKLTEAMQWLESATGSFDQAELMEAITGLVPGYRTSGEVCSSEAGIADTAGPSTAPLRGSAQDDNSGVGRVAE